jgi:tetratricopeptide (TPR) repeat protein
MGDVKARQSAFQSALDNMEPNRSGTVRLANQFINLAEYAWAEKAYLKGKKSGNDGYAYNYEMANLLGIMGRTSEMLEAFLDLLLDSPHYIQTVQNSIDRNLNVQENEDSAEVVRVALLKRVQKYPDVPMYSEMLIWLLGLRNDFGPALVQAKALDKRLNESGYRIMNLAQLAANNDDLETARKAYEYVLEKGKSGDYFVTARGELMKVMQRQILGAPNPSKADIELLEKAYETAISEIGKRPEAGQMMIDLAHFKAFYLGKNDDAKRLLEEVTSVPGVYAKVKAGAKIELADILLMEDDIWEASLLYSQVDLDFKEDIIGHEAKFRNAKISYYTGDFDWAQAQLDVLKASTSKLISNDAIALSLLISDNFNMDTLTLPMELFAKAELYAFQNQKERALENLDKVLKSWPGHSLTDDIYWRKHKIFFEMGQVDKALEFLELIITHHYHDLLADDALFKKADITERVLGNVAEAMKLYETLITDFPGSLFVVEARKRFRTLRGDSLN